MQLVIVGAFGWIFGKRAICNDTAAPTVGRIELRRVTSAADAQAETKPPHGLRERATKVFVARARQWLDPPGGEWSSPLRHSGKSLRQLDREWKYDQG